MLLFQRSSRHKELIGETGESQPQLPEYGALPQKSIYCCDTGAKQFKPCDHFALVYNQLRTTNFPNCCMLGYNDASKFNKVSYRAVDSVRQQVSGLWQLVIQD
jgi:hypothetical protein